MERLKLGTVNSINLNKQSHLMTVSVFFNTLVSQADVLKLERELVKSLELSSVRVQSSFPPELFTADYFQEIVVHLKRDNATLNGTFKDAEARIEDDRFIITLYHGGEAVIKGQNASKLISDAIYDMFGARYKVEFSGVTVMSVDNKAYIEMQNNIEEKKTRIENEKKLEAHEEIMKSAEQRQEKIAKAAPEIEVREGDSLYPVLADKSSKPLFGRAITKINIIPISTLSADTGSAMIWGDVFSIDMRTTKDGKKYIITILITDYTG